MRVDLSPRPAVTTSSTNATSADANTSKGAPSIICCASWPEEPNVKVTVEPVSAMNNWPIFSNAGRRSDAPATNSSCREPSLLSSVTSSGETPVGVSDSAAGVPEAPHATNRLDAAISATAATAAAIARNDFRQQFMRPTVTQCSRGHSRGGCAPERPLCRQSTPQPTQLLPCVEHIEHRSTVR